MNTYMLMDLKRAFVSWRFPASVIGIAAAFYLFGESPLHGDSLISIYQLNIYQVQILLVYVLSIIPYSDALCQDIEHDFYQALIIRGGIVFYSISKGLNIFLSSAAAMIAGTWLYILVLRLQYPQAVWLTENKVQGAFAGVLQKGMFRSYILLCSFQLGLLVGILGMFCAFVSLYILNRLLTLSLPIIIYYIVCYISMILAKQYSFGMIYDPWYTVNNNEGISFLITIGTTVLLFLILQVLILQKVRRRLRNG